ncbi:MAG: InlB B-repeat-containing protein [Sphaerochaeta sp.]
MSNITLYAKWNANTYLVFYRGNAQGNGTAPQSQMKTHGSDLTLAANTGTLQRTGYSFSGWNTQADGFGTDYTSGAVYNTDAEITLYAKWIAEEHNVTLNKQGGSGGSDSITATYDSAMPSATAPTKAGYLFDGYYDQIDGGGTQYYCSAMAGSKAWEKTGNSILYAKWAVAYTASFNSQNGSSVSSMEGVRQGLRIIELTAPARDGYIFGGWFKDISCVIK